MGKLKKTAELGVGAGGAISTVCGLVADFFMPVAPYGIYLGFAGLLLLLISIVLFFIPFTNKRLAVAMNDSWYLPSFVLLLVFTTSMFGFYYFGKSVQGGSGYLAGSFEELSHLQSQILATNLQIEANTRETASNTKRTAENTGALTNLVKRETSDDPRKELGNLGWSWSQESFYDAVATDNDVVVNLFLQGGMRLTSHGYYEYGLNTLIATGAAHGQLVKLLEGQFIDKKIINLTASYAMMSNNRKVYLIAEKLLATVPDGVIPNGLSLNPLTVAIWTGSPKISNLLKEYGATTEPYCAVVEYKTDRCLINIDPLVEAEKYGITND